MGVVAILPMLVTLFHKSPCFISGEFIAYRWGDAMKLRIGSPSTVRPVQGIPTAMLSKMVLAARDPLGAHGGMTRVDLDRYARTYSVAVAAIVVVLSVCAWVSLPTFGALLVSLFLIAPWYIGVASMALFLSPDYWLGEWVWLTATLVMLARRHVNPAGVLPSPLWVFVLYGIWAAVGATLKISLLGAAPILLLSLLIKCPTRRIAAGFPLFVASLLIAYPLVLALYMGSITQGLVLLRFQLNFFRFPNRSVEYAGWRDAFGHKLETSIYIAIALAMSYALLIVGIFRKGTILRTVTAVLVVNLWLLLYILMVSKRPHDSTLDSVSLSALFLIAYLPLLFPSKHRKIVLAAASILLVGTAAAAHFPAEAELLEIQKNNSGNVQYADEFTKLANQSPYAIWFVPTNNWNAVLIPQLLGFNGGLGLFAVYFDEGRLSYRGKGVVFQKLWPNTFLIGADAADFANIRLAAQKGATVYYTKPPDSDEISVGIEHTRLLACLEGTDSTLVEVPVIYNGKLWLFGHTEKRGVAVGQ